MRCLGIDPGTGATGLAVVEAPCKIMGSAVCRRTEKRAIDYLCKVADRAIEMARMHLVDCIAIERFQYLRYSPTLNNETMGQIIGAVLFALRDYQCTLYAPHEWRHRILGANPKREEAHDMIRDFCHDVFIGVRLQTPHERDAAALAMVALEDVYKGKCHA